MDALTRRTVRTASGDFSVIDEGHGRPVVLLHGAPMTSIGFVPMIRALSPAYRVIAPDLPGFGGSSASATFDGSLDAFAASIAEVLEALDLSGVVLYLNDTSGCMGLAAAARAPERIAGLVVADTVPIPLSGRAWFVGAILRYIVASYPVRLLNRYFNAFAWLVATIAPMFRPLPRALRRAMCREFDSHAKRDRIIDVLEAVGRDDTFMIKTESEVRLRLAEVPALILYGQLDPMRMVGGPQRFRELFRRSSSAIVPFEEHFPIFGSADAVAALVDTWIVDAVEGAR